MEEVWKPIEHFPNYNVSNFGNVKNVRTNRVLQPVRLKKQYGYECFHVKLYNESRKKGYNNKVHRLVAIAFIPNPQSKPLVDHIDRNTSNNHVSNLRWADKQENAMNSKQRSDNKTGHKNVFFNTHAKKYQVSVSHKYVGVFSTIDDAIKARDDYLNSQ